MYSRIPIRIKRPGWPLGALAIAYIAERSGIEPEQAALDLQTFLVAGEIRSLGPLDSDSEEPIPRTFWQYGPPSPDGRAYNIETGAKLFWFKVSAEDLLRVWPDAGDAPQQAADTWTAGATITELDPPGARATAAKKSRGGRPVDYDWDAAIREIVRLANTPDGIPSRRALTKHLTSWFAARDEHPSPSRLRQQLARWCPDDLPET